MKKILPYILVIIISVVLSVSVSYLFSSPKTGKTGFVQLGKVYDGFELQKKLSAEFKVNSGSRKNYLDSLEFQVKALYTKANNNRNDKNLLEEFERTQQHYMYQKEQVEQSVGALEEQYNQQIWKQLNEYVALYGKEKGYNYILGAEGSGTLMYGNEANDLTDDMILFINQKYQGK